MFVIVSKSIPNFDWNKTDTIYEFYIFCDISYFGKLYLKISNWFTSNDSYLTHFWYEFLNFYFSSEKSILRIQNMINESYYLKW